MVKVTLQPWDVLSIMRPATGRQYEVGLLAKIKLLRAVMRNSIQPSSASSFQELVSVVRQVLKVPIEMEGVVGEFGCFKGMSTASLSLVCALTKRKLIVFDSFEGLPEPREDATIRNLVGRPTIYSKGDYCGTLSEVQDNVRRWGDTSVCEFVSGYFSDTLPTRSQQERFVTVFEDADLPSSVRDVLTYAWPRLHLGCPFFSHEAQDYEVVELFFDRSFWRNLNSSPPGFIGSGVGIHGWPWKSYLGMARKNAS